MKAAWIETRQVGEAAAFRTAINRPLGTRGIGIRKSRTIAID